MKRRSKPPRLGAEDLAPVLFHQIGEIAIALHECGISDDTKTTAALAIETIRDSVRLLAKVVTGGNPTGTEWQRINALIRGVSR